MLNARFYVDPTSASGLRMKIGNAARNPKTIRRAGDVAGFKNMYGYWEVGIGTTYLKVSRIVWILLHGQIPEGMLVDHMNGDSTLNTEANLQLLTNAQNLRALNKPYSCNKTGYLGVFARPNNSWSAAMRRNGKLKFLGNFSSPVAAARRYNQAVLEWAAQNGETARYLNPV